MSALKLMNFTVTETEQELEQCPTCDSSRLVRIHRTKLERYRLKAKYFCQNCGERFVVKRIEIRSMEHLWRKCRAVCKRTR